MSASRSGDRRGLDEQVAERRVREIGIARRQHDLGVAGEIDACAVGALWLVTETRRSSASSSGETTISVRDFEVDVDAAEHARDRARR